MTVGIAIAKPDVGVWMAYDHNTTQGDIATHNAMKVITRKPMNDRGDELLLSSCGLMALANEIEYGWMPPTLVDGEDPDRWAYLVASRLRDHFHGTDHLWDMVRDGDNGNVQGGFLLAALGRVWTIACNFSVDRPSCGYAAIGSGAEVAMGALHVTEHFAGDDQDVMIQLAMEATRSLVVGISPRYTMEHVPCIRPDS